ncbi:putative receptor-like cytosolic serine/threonine-protein kinase RBK1-like [Capsicum annuum]|nr:putative receptor-like cytosolic serine/threonine-protein kinase RBK1-like [Capsicum annuum]
MDSTVMAEWSQLPRELVELISKHLPTEADFLRFRSVCSSWRSSLPSKPYPSSLSRFPILPNDGIAENSWGFKLSKSPIFLLRSPTSSDNHGWIIKLDRRETPQRMRLLNPLSRSHFKPVPANFPKNLDSSQYPLLELCQEYTLQFIKYRPRANSIADAGNLYMEKVAVRLEVNGFVLLTIHVSGKLVMFRSGDTKWSIVDESSLPYDDVIMKDGIFYAVDNTGRGVLVKLSCGSPPELEVVANSVFGGDKKFLVESCGDLLMVDKYLSIGPEDDFGYNENVEFYEEFDCFMSERTVRFKVYKLDGEMQRWVEVNSLEDRMLFVGDNCTFSALVSQLGSGCKGNCILFSDQFFCSENDNVGFWKDHGIGVFSLENGSIGPISSYQGYAELLWPPPPWIRSPQTIDVRDFLVIVSVNLMVYAIRLCVWLRECDSLMFIPRLDAGSRGAKRGLFLLSVVPWFCIYVLSDISVYHHVIYVQTSVWTHCLSMILLQLNY